MATPPILETNREGDIILEELATMAQCSVEQYLCDSVFVTLLCTDFVKRNEERGKLSPTLMYFEREDGLGYDTYDIIAALTSVSEPDTPPTVEILDPFRDDETVLLPLTPEALADLEELSEALGVSQLKLLEEAINLRLMLQQADSKSLSVYVESDVPDEYFMIPTAFVDGISGI